MGDFHEYALCRWPWPSVQGFRLNGRSIILLRYALQHLLFTLGLKLRFFNNIKIML